MDRMVVRGGRPLVGEVWAGGSKNACLPALAATVLAEGESRVEGVPRLSDVDVMLEILRVLGAITAEEAGESRDGRSGRSLRVDPSSMSLAEVPDPLVRRMRSSIFLMGPLLARFGEVTMTQPGGCSIGPRPIDLHLKGLRQMGAAIEEDGPFIRARARRRSGLRSATGAWRAAGGRPRLRGADITLALASVGATENLMMAATLADGVTTIRNAAREPEIADLADFLNAMGAHVEGAGGGVLRVEGVERLKGTRHRVIPDRIEVGTLLIAIAATGGEGAVLGARPDHLDSVLAYLREAGAEVEAEPGRIRVAGPGRPRPLDLRTQPYPGFPTDLQNPALALLLRADGTSVVTESVFENRFQVASEFHRMGASLTVDGRTAIVRGVPRLTGAWVEARELRGGAALLIAALSARGESQIDGIRHVDRGYEMIEDRLRDLGAEVTRVRAV